MANKFVWDAATGAADGSTWEDAYDSLMRDWGAEAGFTPGTDFVYVRSIHTETSGSSIFLTGGTVKGTTARVRILSVVGAATGTAPGALQAGAAVNTNATTADIGMIEGLYINGVDFFSNDDLNVATGGTSHDITLENCRLELIGTFANDNMNFGIGGSGNSTLINLINVTVDFGANTQGIQINAGTITWIGGSVATDVAVLFESPASSVASLINIVGVDFSAFSTRPLINGATSVEVDALVKFSRCLLGTGGTIVTGTIDTPGFRVESYHCQIGTDSDPAYQMEIQDSRGKTEMDTARYRTGGASDGVRTNEYSWSMDTTVGSVRGYPGHALESPPIDAWTDGDASTAHTYRLYIASGGTLNDDDIWFELEGPNDAATDSMAVINTTRVAPRTTAAAYTTDGSSTWTGADVGTKQQMDITYTPDKPGPIRARVYMAVASDRVSIDPKIAIDP